MNWICSCWPTSQPQQHWIQAAPVSYTTGCSKHKDIQILNPRAICNLFVMYLISKPIFGKKKKKATITNPRVQISCYSFRRLLFFCVQGHIFKLSCLFTWIQAKKFSLFKFVGAYKNFLASLKFSRESQISVVIFSILQIFCIFQSILVYLCSYVSFRILKRMYMFS